VVHATFNPVVTYVALILFLNFFHSNTVKSSIHDVLYEFFVSLEKAPSYGWERHSWQNQRGKKDPVTQPPTLRLPVGVGRGKSWGACNKGPGTQTPRLGSATVQHRRRQRGMTDDRLSAHR